MIVALLMSVLLFLVILILRDVIKSDKPSENNGLGLFAYKDDKYQPTKNKLSKGKRSA